MDAVPDHIILDSPFHQWMAVNQCSDLEMIPEQMTVENGKATVI